MDLYFFKLFWKKNPPFYSRRNIVIAMYMVPVLICLFKCSWDYVLTHADNFGSESAC